MITEFFGLQSKLCSFLVNGQNFVKKAKDVKASVAMKCITSDDYTECLRNFGIQSRSQHVTRSQLHNVETIEQENIAQNPYCNKRYLLTNSTDILA